MNGYALVRASRAGKKPEISCAAVINFDALMAGAKKRGLTGSEGERAGKRARHIRFSD